MSTVAWDGSTLAADTQFGEYIEQGEIQKIGRSPRGWLWGVTGSMEITRVIAEYLRENDQKDDFFKPSFAFEHAPKIKWEDVNVLIIDHEGQCWWLGENGVPLPVPVPQAIGTGTPFAMGAMVAGMSAVEAVEIAMKLDTATGGKISIKTLDPTIRQVAAGQ